MKVLHVLAQLPMRTGSGVYYTNLIEGLENSPLEIENALIYGIQNPYEFDFHQQTFPVNFKSEQIPFPIVGMSDVMPYDNTVYSQMPHEDYLVWEAAFKERLIEARETFRPDVIISHHLWYLTTLVLDLFPEIPVIGISHGTDIRQALQNPQLKDKYTRDFNRLEMVFALSQKDKQSVTDVFGVDEDKIIITQAGFNQKVFNAHDLEASKDRINIVYAGKIAHAKGVYELAKAFPIIKSQHTEVVMHFIGCADDDNCRQLEAMAGDSKDFHIYDVKNQDALASCMKQCDIFVLPSYYEGLGLIAIEALACKLRVVVTEIEGLIELLGEQVNNSDVIEYVELPRLFNQDQPMPEDIPAYVDRLANALNLQIERVKAGMEFPEDIYNLIYQHSWSEVVKKQQKAIESVYAKYQSEVISK